MEKPFGTDLASTQALTHLFQVLGFVAMEPPVALDAASLHEEKLKVFQATSRSTRRASSAADTRATKVRADAHARWARMRFDYADSFCTAAELEAYERLIHDAMLGDRTLFTSSEGIERLLEGRRAGARFAAAGAGVRVRLVGAGGRGRPDRTAFLAPARPLGEGARGPRVRRRRPRAPRRPRPETRRGTPGARRSRPDARGMLPDAAREGEGVDAAERDRHRAHGAGDAVREDGEREPRVGIVRAFDFLDPRGHPREAE